MLTQQWLRDLGKQKLKTIIKDSYKEKKPLAKKEKKLMRFVRI
jgi:hypothetical protein